MTTRPKIGAFVLETLTTGMYTEPLDSIREYIQNAADSIRNAESEGLLKPGEGRVDILIDPKKRLVTIRDNGIGIPQEFFKGRIENIGMSEKKLGTDAGFRGIGRLAGIAYCESLCFRSSYKSEKKVSEITFDCESIREACSPKSRRNDELSEVLEKHNSYSTQEAASSEHFFEVVLSNVSEAGDEFLDLKALEHYLSQVAPVPLDAHSFIFAPVINQWMEKNKLSVPYLNLILKTPEFERQVFKPFKGYYRTAQNDYKIEIKDVGFFPESPTPDSPFWLWYGKSDLLGMIDDDKSAGFRFRKNNIALGGPEQVAKLFAKRAISNSRFNAYFVGEIYLNSPDVIPNARRDALEDNDTWREIEKGLLPFIDEKSQEIRDSSKDRNRPVQKIVASTTSVIEDAKERLEPGLASDTERNTILSKIEKEKQKVASAISSKRDPEEAQKLKDCLDKLEKTEKEVSKRDKETFITHKVRTDLDKKQQRLLKQIFEIMCTSFNSDFCPKGEACFKRMKAILLEKLNADEGKPTKE